MHFFKKYYIIWIILKISFHVLLFLKGLIFVNAAAVGIHVSGVAGGITCAVVHSCVQAGLRVEGQVHYQWW